jgi:hypothetical protein
MRMTTLAADPQAEPIYASYSSIGKHRLCPQAWAYGTIRRLEHIEDDDAAVERDMGSWWHALRAADSIERGRELGSLQWTPDRLTSVDGGPTVELLGCTDPVEQVAKAAAAWWETQSLGTQVTWQDRIGGGLPQRLASMYAAWQEQWGDEIEDEEPLAVELRWERELPMPEGARRLILVGYVDEITRVRRRRVVLARDHKAAKRLGTQTAVDDMMDSQLQLYAWGASPTVTSWGQGKIQATGYDRACMVAPRPPRLTSSGKLGTYNGEPSIGMCDLATYVAWAAGPDGRGQPWQGAAMPRLKSEPDDAPRRYKPGGLYTAEQDVIERLGTPAARSQWFQRTTVPLNGNLIRAHLQAAVETALTMGRTRALVAATGAGGRNLGAPCKYCDFVGLCRAEMVGGPGGDYDLGDFALREKPRSAGRR